MMLRTALSKHWYKKYGVKTTINTKFQGKKFEIWALKQRETIYYEKLPLETILYFQNLSKKERYMPKIHQILGKFGKNHYNVKISEEIWRKMFSKPTGNALLQKFSLRKLYFTFKIF